MTLKMLPTHELWLSANEEFYLLWKLRSSLKNVNCAATLARIKHISYWKQKFQGTKFTTSTFHVYRKTISHDKSPKCIVGNNIQKCSFPFDCHISYWDCNHRHSMRIQLYSINFVFLTDWVLLSVFQVQVNEL